MKCAFPAAQNAADTSLPTRRAEIALIELYIGLSRVRAAKSSARRTFTNNVKLNAAYIAGALIHNGEAGAVWLVF